MSNLFKKLTVILLAAVIGCAFVGCMNSSDGYHGKAGYGDGGYGGGGYGGYGREEMAAPAGDAGYEGDVGYEYYDDYETPDVGYEGNNQMSAGRITASAWNDNTYYDYFKSMFAKGETPDVQEGQENEQTSASTEDGKFYNFYTSDRWGFDALHRVTVNVTAEDKPVQGAVVSYYGADQTLRKAVTDAKGVAYIFPENEEGEITVTSGTFTKKSAYSTDNKQITVALDGGESKASVIKLMFVVDVTGSMGDEIEYLSAELADVINRVARANEGVRIDLAFLFYRDDGDQQKFAYFDFRTVTESAGLSAQLKNLSKQYATGGGDYPEALDEAMEMAVNKNWGTENSTKIIFHVYDAPPHTLNTNKITYENAVRTAAAKGIRINPVLCSGADLLCEYLGRQAAIHTGGHFVYVTDDSGIGNAHYDPDIPNAVVEKLNELIIRLVNGYYTGEFAEPVYWKTETSATANE